MASIATHDDLRQVTGLLANAEAARTAAVELLASIDARRDGDEAAGMPLAQHLRWTTNLAHGTVNQLLTVAAILGHMPTVATAYHDGRVSFDQARAIAYPARGVAADRRTHLDAALADTGTDWHHWDPDLLEAECCRLLDETAPRCLEERETTTAQREYLHMQPELDGQAVRFWGRYEGVHAALLDATLTAAAATPRPTTNGDQARPRQLAAGLARILTDWQTGSCPHGRTTDGSTTPGAHIQVVVDEDSPGTATIWTNTPGLRPRLSAPTARDLAANPRSTTHTLRTRDGLPVSVDGREGHAIDVPDLLSDDTRRRLVRLRDARCRAPGCSAPALWTEQHHVHHRAHGGLDRTDNLLSLCRRCHLRLVHGRRWQIQVLPDGTATWRNGTRTTTTLPRHRCRLRQPRGDPDLPF